MVNKETTTPELEELIERQDLELAKQFEYVVKLKSEIENYRRNRGQKDEYFKNSQSLLKERCVEESRARDELERQLKNRDEQVNRLKDELNARLGELKGMHKEIEELTFNLYEKETIAGELQDSILELQQQVANLNERHTFEVGELKKFLESEIDEKNRIVSMLENTKNLLLAKNESLEAEKSSVRQLEELISNMKSQIVKFKVNESMLETELDRKRYELADALKKLEAATNKIETLERKLVVKDEALSSQSKSFDLQKMKMEGSLNHSALDDFVTSREDSVQYIRNVFAMAKEKGEVFDSRCLADLAGNCKSPENSEERISILQKRNSMCPPHLRSSYPVETQFLDPHKFEENNLRNPSSSRIETATQLHPKQDPKKNIIRTETERGFVLKDTINYPRRGTLSHIHSYKKDQNTPPSRRRR